MKICCFVWSELLLYPFFQAEYSTVSFNVLCGTELEAKPKLSRLILQMSNTGSAPGQYFVTSPAWSLIRMQPLASVSFKLFLILFVTHALQHVSGQLKPREARLGSLLERKEIQFHELQKKLWI